LVVLAHGGGQTRHAWGSTLELLADHGYLAVALDARGHGDSGWAGDGAYGLEAFAADLRAVVGQLDRPAALVGASLGGLSSLLAVGEPPEVDATAVVLVDVTPRMEASGTSRIGEFMTARPEGFASLDEVADAVAAYLPHRPRPTDVSGLEKNVRLDADGRYRWHWDPAFHAGLGGSSGLAPERLERAAQRIGVPILLVRGKLSELVSETSVAAFRAIVPQAEYVDVAGAGHMVAGDQNDAFTGAILDFLVRHVPPVGPPDSGR
jgi:non-heme chloroperoxidase